MSNHPLRALALSSCVLVFSAHAQSAASTPAPAATVSAQTFAVRALRVEGDGAHPGGIDPARLQARADAALDARRPTPGAAAELDLAQLQDIAAELSTFYRTAGYPVATVIVPPQQIGADQIVVLKAFEGRVGKVLVRGDSRYARTLQDGAGSRLPGQAVRTADLERAVLYARDLPGVSVSSILVPGENTGETDVVIEAHDTRNPLQVSIGANNYGTEQTGRGRAQLDVNWASPLGLGDVLAASYTYAFDPEQSRLWAFSYSVPVAPVPGLSVIAGANRGELEIRNGLLASLGLSGPSSQQYLGGDWKFVNSVRWQATASARYVREKSRIQALGFDLSNQKFDVAELGMSARRNDAHWGGVNVLQVSARKALDDNSVYPDLISAHHDPHFLLARADFLRMQPLAPTQRMFLRLSGQYTRDALIPMEQFGVGGADTVRAYPLNDAMGDRGWYGALQYQVDAPGFADRPSPFAGQAWRELLSFDVFVDHGRTSAAGDNRGFVQSATLDGAGAGMTFRLPRWHDLQFNLSAAVPTGGRDASDGDDFRVYARFGMTF